MINMTPESIDITELTLTDYTIAQWTALGWELRALALLVLLSGVFYLLYWLFDKYVRVDLLGD